VRGRINCRWGVREGRTIRSFARELIQEVEPIAFGVCGLRPAELWNMTPAELLAVIEANIQFKTPAGSVNKRRETEGIQMTPEQIAERLRIIAGVKV